MCAKMLWASARLFVCVSACVCMSACMCVCVHSGGECVQIAGRVDVERGHCRHRD